MIVIEESSEEGDEFQVVVDQSSSDSSVELYSSGPGEAEYFEEN